jgi:hypothetical protein
MALNITFTCNSIYDENNNKINCYYQAYHPRTNKWNNVRLSEYSQYSFNAGDGDFLTQSGELKQGDWVYICFWENDETRSGLKNRFSYFKLIHDGITNTYIIDPQLIPKTLPNCGWSLTNNDLRVNQTVYVIDTSSDSFSWSFNNHTFYHKRTEGEELIFDSVGIQNVKYNWDYNDNPDNFLTANNNSYSNIGDYVIKQKVTNYYGVSRICSKNIRVKYNTPRGGINFNYTSPIHTTESVSVNADILDKDFTITNIEHRLIIKNRNSNEQISDTLFEENTNLGFIYSDIIDVFQKHYYKQVIHWNDGYENNILNYNKELPITNWEPTVSLSKSDISDSEKAFVQVSNDIDGKVVNWSWKIYFIAPFSSGEYSEVYSYNTDSGEDWLVTFTVSGEYKVKLTVIDDYGDSASDELEFVINSSERCPEINNEIDINKIKFIFPKQMIN